MSRFDPDPSRQGGQAPGGRDGRIRSQQLSAWLAHRVPLPPGPPVCVIDGPARGRRRAAPAARGELRELGHTISGPPRPTCRASTRQRSSTQPAPAGSQTSRSQPDCDPDLPLRPPVHRRAAGNGSAAPDPPAPAAESRLLGSCLADRHTSSDGAPDRAQPGPGQFAAVLVASAGRRRSGVPHQRNVAADQRAVLLSRRP